MNRTLIDRLRGAALPLSGAASDYDALLEAIGESHFVLIGEASHGTHEFYRQRALLTRRFQRRLQHLSGQRHSGQQLGRAGAA